MDAARRSKRYASDQPLLVSCESWHDFVALYAADIGQGGMFILMEDTPPLMSVIDIRLQLPEATEIALRGRVVHVITREQAQAEHKQPGAGVEFIEMDAERKRQIVQLVEFARWQGASGDPRASFARTLMEQAQHASPAKTGASAAQANSARPEQRPPAMQTSTVTSRSTIERDARRTTSDGETRPAAQRDPRRITLDGEQRAVHPADQQFSLRPDASEKKRAGSRSSVPTTPAAASSGAPAGVSGKPASDKPAVAAKPTDPAQLKIVVTHFAHKRYDQALKVVREMLVANPGDAQALKWQHMCTARMALAKNEGPAALEAYEKALTYDEANHEAREFVRTYHRDKRLNALPFGRYFVKKK